MAQKFRVMVVDDSAFMRKLITDLISEDPEFQVVYAANNGREALERIAEIQPDVITMDIEMPEMNGLEALKAIMQCHPVPVIMLSSYADEAARETIMALELGAVDFIRKPSGSISLDLYSVKNTLIEKLKIAVETRVKSISFEHTGVVETKAAKAQISLTEPIRQIVAIGTSTGGPRALQQVLSRIPALIPAPILIVQHMPPKFTKSLAQRLDSSCEVHVVEAQDGESVKAGTVYIAPGGSHMKLVRHAGELRIQLTLEEARNGHRPSVDVLFESLIPLGGLIKHVVLMTGMGSDGAKGMKALKDAGAVTTIAESEETAVVYGMPRSAVELGCVTDLLPLQHISKKIMDSVMSHQRPEP
ncbi:protein-glutamate methylesterase/protein-glutamine glutaminase [Ferviditalea candida]|uniref:Protein-glutamate methylesterase/protein-glutamine glutaminase n=1 Tax=Ferviditalea candida TaxID=3108399 RepID=A0ABU5ZF75_9BACL|nr:chemotaxis response regulator protein-glutamate methylesterase [Paenibacillaceae bacterium T2]